MVFVASKLPYRASKQFSVKRVQIVESSPVLCPRSSTHSPSLAKLGGVADAVEQAHAYYMLRAATSQEPSHLHQWIRGPWVRCTSFC